MNGGLISKMYFVFLGMIPGSVRAVEKMNNTVKNKKIYWKMFTIVKRSGLFCQTEYSSRKRFVAATSACCCINIPNYLFYSKNNHRGCFTGAQTFSRMTLSKVTLCRIYGLLTIQKP